jgi:hypothetical protein
VKGQFARCSVFKEQMCFSPSPHLSGDLINISQPLTIAQPLSFNFIQVKNDITAAPQKSP